MKNKNQRQNEHQELDRRQFLKLFMNSQKVIHNYILSMVHDKSDAEDLTQETALLMWDKFDEFEPGTSFVAWGVKIAHYKVLSFFKAKKHLKLFDDELLEHISGNYQEKLDEVEDKLEALEHCLTKLDNKDRKLLSHYYDQGLKVTQLTDVMGSSIHALYRSMARIHDSLFCCINRTIREWDTNG